MGIKVTLRSGESTISLIRRFKRICEKEKLMKDYRKHANYEKPSDIERRKRLMRKVNARKANLEQMNEYEDDNFGFNEPVIKKERR